MSETTFRFIVAGSVAAVILAFVVQAAIVVAMWRTIGEIQRDMARGFATCGRVFAKAAALFTETERMIERIELVIHSANATAARIRLTLFLVRPITARTRVVAGQAAVFIDATGDAAGAAGQILQEFHAASVRIHGELGGIERSVRPLAAEVEGLIHGAGDALRRLKQMGHDARRIAGGVGEISHAALRPVRVVRGIDAGISAARAKLSPSMAPEATSHSVNGKRNGGSRQEAGGEAQGTGDAAALNGPFENERRHAARR